LGGDARLIWGSSTPITKPGDVNTLGEGNAVVTARNALAAEIMAERGIPVDDLYQVVVGKPDLRSPDGYHYSGPGYEALGKAVADAILQATR
jgi:lysophospholipase L1-like esterase